MPRRALIPLFTIAALAAIHSIAQMRNKVWARYEHEMQDPVMGFTWDDIAKDPGGTKNDIRELRKTANFETGVRHASKSGLKMRANVRNYGSYVAGLFDMINAARAKVAPRIRDRGGEGGRQVSCPRRPPCAI